MEFRRAGAEDIPRLIQLRQRQLHDEAPQPSCSIDGALDRFFCAMMARDQLVEFVAEEDGEIVATGAVCFYLFPPSFTNPSGTVAYITNMYTHPDFRRRGLATRMLDLLTEECRRRGVRRVLLAASRWGRPVYEAYGFQPEPKWYALQLDRPSFLRPALDRGAGV